MAAIQKIFLLYFCTLLGTSCATGPYYETIDGETRIVDEGLENTLSDIDTLNTTTLETISTTQTARSKSSTQKENINTNSNQSLNSMNSDEITRVNKKGGTSSSKENIKSQEDEEVFSRTLSSEKLKSTSKTVKITEGQINLGRSVRQAGNGSVGNDSQKLNVTNTTSINSTTKPGQNGTTFVPTTVNNKVTTNATTSTTESRKKFWTSLKYTVAGAVGVVGVFLWAYYIINGVH